MGLGVGGDGKHYVLNLAELALACFAINTSHSYNGGIYGKGTHRENVYKQLLFSKNQIQVHVALNRLSPS